MLQTDRKNLLTMGALCLAIAVALVCMAFAPGGSPYYDLDRREVTKASLFLGDGPEGERAVLDDPDTVAALVDYLNRFTYSTRTPFWNGPTITLALEGEGGTRYCCLSPYGVVDREESLAYHNGGPYFQALFDLMIEP